LISAFFCRKCNQCRLTLEMLSAKMGVSSQHLSEIESGKHDHRLSSIKRMAEAMGMTVLIVLDAVVPDLHRDDGLHEGVTYERDGEKHGPFASRLLDFRNRISVTLSKKMVRKVKTVGVMAFGLGIKPDSTAPCLPLPSMFNDGGQLRILRLPT
jgi:transcriptional regulator with XRE-family HTH domain